MTFDGIPVTFNRSDFDHCMYESSRRDRNKDQFSVRRSERIDWIWETLGDETLKTIARELVATVQKNTTIDWTVRENVRAHLRVLVKRILRKYGYPPDKQEKATFTVLEQAEVLSANWVMT